MIIEVHTTSTKNAQDIYLSKNAQDLSSDVPWPAARGVGVIE